MPCVAIVKQDLIYDAFICYVSYWSLVRAIYVVDGWFLGDFFWKVEGSSAHTRESRVANM